MFLAVMLMASLGAPSTASAGGGDLLSRRVYPNPFTEGTTFQLTMPKSAKIRITVYDLLGREIRTLFEGEHGATINQEPVYWDGRDRNNIAVPPGIYICVLFSEDVAVKSVKVIKASN
jgi:hypothetical protein